MSASLGHLFICQSALGQSYPGITLFIILFSVAGIVAFSQDHPRLGKLFITIAAIPIVGAILFYIYLIITFAIVGNKLQG